MEYTNGDGRERSIEILTEEGVRYLVGYEGDIPKQVWYTFENWRLLGEKVNRGSLYLVERVLQQWPSELPGDEVLHQRLDSLRRGIDRTISPMSVGGASYCILDKPDLTD